MKIFSYEFMLSVINYIHENLSCLLYVVDYVPEQTVYFTAYFSLVRDISEAYGSWVALLFVLISTLSLTILVQQLITYGVNYLWYVTRTKGSTSANNISTDSFFLKSYIFSFFKKK